MLTSSILFYIASKELFLKVSKDGLRFIKGNPYGFTFHPYGNLTASLLAPRIHLWCDRACVTNLIKSIISSLVKGACNL